MPRSAILTIEAASPGGVPALVETLYALLHGQGEDPTVYRAAFAAGPLTPLQRAAWWLRHLKPRLTEDRGLRTILVPAPPFPLWLFYAVPHFLLGPLLGEYPRALVASGSAHVALPLALRGIPYAAWVATLYEDELRAKEASGDAWASAVLRSPMWPLLAWQEKLCLRRAGRIMALSYHTAERIKALVPEAAEHISVVLYPVDSTRFHPPTGPREAGTPHGRYILFAARINDPRKNTAILLEAFRRVHETHPDLKLVLCGEEPDAALRAVISEHGLADAVICRGAVSTDELLNLYQHAQLFALPSLQEGLGIVVLEALACGTPVVAFESGGPSGIVIDGETGRLLPDPRNSAAYAQAILGLLDDPQALEAMRARCVGHARRTYDRPVITGRIRAAYDELLNDTPDLPLRAWLAAGWAVLVAAAYGLNLFQRHWPAIQSQIIGPLLGSLR
ncbi:MAG: glycosyltransferase family 4 protein [Anaerolineae bacterium]|nr:glycosyltransferase family 4 protein [Anaerolineae bacterium]